MSLFSGLSQLVCLVDKRDNSGWIALENVCAAPYDGGDVPQGEAPGVVRAHILLRVDIVPQSSPQLTTAAALAAHSICSHSYNTLSYYPAWCNSYQIVAGTGSQCPDLYFLPPQRVKQSVSPRLQDWRYLPQDLDSELGWTRSGSVVWHKPWSCDTSGPGTFSGILCCEWREWYTLLAFEYYERFGIPHLLVDCLYANLKITVVTRFSCLCQLRPGWGMKQHWVT